jgi:DNA-binding NtrC family response regulator
MQQSPGTTSAASLLVTGDLIFSTKITGTARALGIEMHVVGSGAAALERLRQLGPCCVWLDLGAASLTPVVLQEIVQLAAGRSVVAFGSHVDTERLDAARVAGCTEVMPRSRLSQELPKLLERYSKSKDASGDSNEPNRAQPV